MYLRFVKFSLLTWVFAAGLRASEANSNAFDNGFAETAEATTVQTGYVQSQPRNTKLDRRQVFQGDWLASKPFKKISLGEEGWLDVGGSYRARHHRENNIRPGTVGGVSGLDDTFWLHQTRLWVDGQWNPRIGFRVGMLDAASDGEVFPSRAREVNRLDLYQAHANIVMHEGEGKLTARLGRQEIRYGSARLMMAPGWANRRRTHDGVRFIYESEDWEVNPFWVRPAIRNSSNFTSFDETNPDQQLYGIFSTYKGLEHDQIDLYWLAYDLRNVGTGARYDTLASRYVGERNDWLYEVEGGVQLGDNPDDTNHIAGFVTCGLGRKLPSLAWKPELWLYYDWASGDDTVGNGFHHYVPRAHYYLGFMDLFGRRNIEDLNILLTAKPTDKLSLLAWCHFFSLANGNDVPYNLNMRPYAGLSSGSAGSQTLGTELDLMVNYDFSDQTQFRFGYSYFWAGKFYDTTPGVPSNDDASFLYSHISYRF